MKSNWRLLLGRALEEHGESWSDVEASSTLARMIFFQQHITPPLGLLILPQHHRPHGSPCGLLLWSAA